MDEKIFNELSNMLGNSKEDNFSRKEKNNDTSSFNNFDFSNLDMSTIIKVKNALEKINTKKNDPRSNLLISLKPYLKPSKQEQLDKYMKMINLTSMIEVFNTLGGDNIK